MHPRVDPTLSRRDQNWLRPGGGTGSGGELNCVCPAWVAYDNPLAVWDCRGFLWEYLNET